ncbi:amidase [Parvibaculaceae bacterium PLY_AMNH_Bact1]|nr:amidase [Parvibaculaceae bacterium PLY_AMNH_Bact1]
MDRRNFLRGSAAVGALATVVKPTVAWADSDPFVRLDGMAQADLVRRGEVSSLELVDAAISRIEKLNPKINAVVSTRFDKARELAASDSIPDGPFKGVPYLIKDLSELEGEPQTFGSKLFAGNIADRDNGGVARAKEAGLIILGKTNTPEFGLLGTTESELLGAAHNPWNLDYHTGGSSGGAAAAVASGMVPFAHASDGGGSIRIPASVCGLVGLKPSRSRMFTEGDDAMPGDIGVRLAVSRSVRDTAQILNVSERNGSDAVYEPTGFVAGPGTKRLKIGYSTLNYAGNDASPDVKAAIDATAKLCADLGHEIVETKPFLNADEFLENFMGIWASSPAFLVDNAWLIGLTQFRWTSAEEGLEPWTRGLAEWFEKKEAANPGVIERSLAYFAQVVQEYDAYFETLDVELTPVLRTPPVLLGEQAPDLPFEQLFERTLDYVSYTPQHNVAGTPAISLPLFTSAEGLPIGSQFATKRGGEHTLLELAYELEAALPWAGRWAPTSAVNL